jgi:hypothetical protein
VFTNRSTEQFDFLYGKVDRIFSVYSASLSETTKIWYVRKASRLRNKQWEWGTLEGAKRPVMWRQVTLVTSDVSKNVTKT